jgi:hypothetical protein
VDADSQRLLWVGVSHEKLLTLVNQRFAHGRVLALLHKGNSEPEPSLAKRIKVRVLSWLPIEDLL